MPDRRTPISHAVDLFVYAPLGLLFEAPKMLPRLVARGRQEAGAAIETGLGLLGRRDPASAGTSGSHAQNTLRALGLLPLSEPTLSAVPDPDDGVRDPDPPSPDPIDETPVPATPAGPAAVELAIPEYESLSASQVVPRLGSLSDDELEAVRLFELGNRHRSTILNKISQLQGS